MKRAFASALLALFSLDAIAAEPELIRPPFPGAAQWKLVTDQPELKEWIPENQSADDTQDFWRQKAVRRQNKPLQAVEVLNDALGVRRAQCGELRGNGRRAQTVNGISSVYIEITCVKPKDPERDFVVVIKALGNEETVHLLEREFRKPRRSGTRPPELSAPPPGMSEQVLELASLLAVTRYFPSVRITPAFGEKLVVPVYPTGNWKTLADSGTDAQTLVEYIPEGQTAQTMTDLLQIRTGFGAQQAQPKAFMTSLFTGFSKSCSSMNVNGPVEAIENGHAVAYGEMFCKNSKQPAGKDMDIFVKVIQGKEALYIIQRDFHRPTEPGTAAGERRYRPDQGEQMKADNAAIETAQTFLKQVRLCPVNDAVCLTPVPAP